jgi:hypothetical protein
MRSSLAVNDFLDEHELEKDSFGHCEFRGLVEYTSNVINASEITIIKLIRNGYNDGDIQITENGDLNYENFHLDFTTNYQNYTFNTADNSLVVSGNSGKMGGNYQVVLKVL